MLARIVFKESGRSDTGNSTSSLLVAGPSGATPFGSCSPPHDMSHDMYRIRLKCPERTSSDTRWYNAVLQSVCSRGSEIRNSKMTPVVSRPELAQEERSRCATKILAIPGLYSEVHHSNMVRTEALWSWDMLQHLIDKSSHVGAFSALSRSFTKELRAAGGARTLESSWSLRWLISL